jgi:ABC-type nitrate/sulfonate/bicarbonate transport system substrate-binding protein
MKDVKRLVILVIVALLVSGLPLSAQDDAPVHVVQAGFLVTTISPVFIAIENGYFLDEGLDLEFVEIDSGQLGVSALMTGLAEFSDLGVEDVANLQAQDQDVVLVYSMVNSLTMNLVVRTEVLEEKGVSRESPLEERFASLEGMIFGITRPGAPTDLYPRWLMMQAGLDPETDAEFVAIGGGAALLAALETGQIDAYLLSPPTPFIAEQEGFGQILIMNSSGDVPEFRDFAFTSTVVAREWAEANPELVEAYSRAVDRGYQFMIDNTDEAVQILNESYFPDTDPAVLRIGIDATLSAMRADGEFTEQAIINQLQVLDEIGELEAMPDTSEGVLWTNQYNPDTLDDEMYSEGDAAE